MTDYKKDTENAVKDSQNMAVSDSVSYSYKRANKLITALYMVTDIMDKTEPLRNRLRILGADILSDLYARPSQARQKATEVMSFLDIASTIGMISGMNAGILAKEFANLKNSIPGPSLEGDSAWLTGFLAPEKEPSSRIISGPVTIPAPKSGIDESQTTRLGVQKASALMNALSKVAMSDTGPLRPQNASLLKSHLGQASGHDFNMLKQQRRSEIIKIIKEDKAARERGGATISDIRNSAKQYASSLGIKALLSTGEKTLQRELVSMVKDNVLKKSGEKRWSRYSIS